MTATATKTTRHGYAPYDYELLDRMAEDPGVIRALQVEAITAAARDAGKDGRTFTVADVRERLKVEVNPHLPGCVLSNMGQKGTLVGVGWAPSENVAQRNRHRLVREWRFAS